MVAENAAVRVVADMVRLAVLARAAGEVGLAPVAVTAREAVARVTRRARSAHVVTAV